MGVTAEEDEQEEKSVRVYVYNSLHICFGWFIKRYYVIRKYLFGKNRID